MAIAQVCKGGISPVPRDDTVRGCWVFVPQHASRHPHADSGIGERIGAWGNNVAIGLLAIPKSFERKLPCEMPRSALPLHGHVSLVPIALAALAAAGALMMTPKLLGDPDTYWHLATGEWILRHRQVPHVDPFSYTFFGHAWTAQEWLSELLMALAFRGGGWSALLLLSGLSFAAALIVLGVYLTRFLSTRVTLAVLLFVGLGVEPMLLARPHVLALPVLAAWAVGLISARDADRRPSFWLFPLMTLWANLHGSFILGLALIGPFALEALLADRRKALRTILDWSVFGVGALLASLITPNGVEGFLHPFAIMGMRSLQEIGEWRSTDFSQLGLFEVVLLEALFFCLWLGVKISPLRLVLMLALLHMALQHTRHQPVFLVLAALLSAPGLASAIAASFPARERQPTANLPLGYAVAAVLAMLCLVVGLRLAFHVERREDPLSPIRALAAVPDGLRAQPVYNDYLFGGYLIFAGVRPYIDGRADMYGDAFLLNYTSMKNSSPEHVRAELDRRGAQWTILQSTSRVAAMLDGSPQWVRIWSDQIATVHVRRAALPQAQ